VRPDLSEGTGAVYQSQFSVGGVSVQLDGGRGEDVTLVPPLEPFRVRTGISDVNIRVERVIRLAPASGRRLFDSGTTWELSQGDGMFQFDFTAAIFGNRPIKRLLIDSCFRQATLQMNEECLADFPFTIEPLAIRSTSC